MSSPIKPLRLAALLAAAATLSACDVGGIGEGNRLETLEIVRTTALIDRESSTSYVCFPDKLQLVGTFTDGGQGDYSSRGRWTSSDPSVVAVSNGDILIPGSTTLAYASGTIVPKTVTTTPVIITADFVGLSASYEVVVKKIDTGAIEISATSVKLAPETLYPLTLKATVDGYELNLTSTSAVTWSFVDADEDTDDIAVIGAGTGVISAKLPETLPATLRARAEFAECQNDAGTAPLRFEADVAIENPTSLTLEREFAADAPLVVKTTEALKVTAGFADSSTQDLTGQVKLDSSDDEVIVPGAFAPQIVSALKAGTVTLKAIYGGPVNDDDEEYPPQLESNVLTMNAVDGTLQSFEISPLNPTIAAFGNQQFTALGSFSVAGETREQPITRHVVWTATTLDDKTTAAVAISNSSVSKGLAVSLQPESDSAKIKATYVRDEPDPDLVEETVLCIVKPGEAAGSCPPEEAP